MSAFAVFASNKNAKMSVLVIKLKRPVCGFNR